MEHVIVAAEIQVAIRPSFYGWVLINRTTYEIQNGIFFDYKQQAQQYANQQGYIVNNSSLDD